MSTHVITQIRCDGVDCDEWHDGPPNQSVARVGQTRAILRRDGWVRRKCNGKLVDLCWKCKQKER